jgi:hypothetical protein
MTTPSKWVSLDGLWILSYQAKKSVFEYGILGRTKNANKIQANILKPNPAVYSYFAGWCILIQFIHKGQYFGSHKYNSVGKNIAFYM